VIEVYVDADACPVKDEIYQVAGRYELPVILVANSAISIPHGVGVEMVVVGNGPDAADDWIAENVHPFDVVVTADIPLAARCLEAGARVLGSSGRSFDEDMIGTALAKRELNSQLREMGQQSGGPPPMARKDRSRFLSALDKMINTSLRDAGA
jgi:uncharacterized protein YaiI (UPF0178 family)